jgi:hypothetical protein
MLIQIIVWSISDPLTYSLSSLCISVDVIFGGVGVKIVFKRPRSYSAIAGYSKI